MLRKGLSLNVGRIGDNIGVNGNLLGQEVEARLAVAVIQQISRPNLMAVLDKDLRNMPAAAAGFPDVFREGFEL